MRKGGEEIRCEDERRQDEEGQGHAVVDHGVEHVTIIFQYTDLQLHSS